MRDLLELIGVVLSLALAGGGAYAVIALISVWVKRVERRGAAQDPALEEELLRLRDRVHQLEGAEERMAELEERLDFAERMLAQARDARLGAGEGR